MTDQSADNPSSGLGDIATVLKISNQNVSQLITALLNLRMFEPTDGTGALISATTTSANTQLGNGDQVRVCNFGTVTANIRFGADSSVTAATTDMAILPNTVEIVSIPEDLNISSPRPYLAVRSYSGSTLVSIVTGFGA